MLFVIRIVTLVISNNILMLFIAWDGLGLRRFILVLFYTHWDSVNSALVTVLTNRLGDYCLFWFISGLMIRRITVRINIRVTIIIILLVMAFTKSAQFPFRAWLPKAIAAPTPVSSLVHRRTLVTAGIFLLIKYFPLWINTTLSNYVLIIGLLTMVAARLSALTEIDIKKVVALRTLSQIGFLMTTLGLGLPFFTFIHLISHALFKSCLFLQVGYIIHEQLNNQDIRLYTIRSGGSLISKLQISLCLLCLCGFTFTRGFVRKDIIIERSLGSTTQIRITLVILLSVFITFLYCLRLFKSLVLVGVSSSLHYNLKRMRFQFVRFILCVIRLIFLIWSTLNITYFPIFTLLGDKFTPSLFIFLVVLIVSYITHNYIINTWKLFYTLFNRDVLVYITQKGLVNVNIRDSIFLGLGYKRILIVSIVSKYFTYNLIYYRFNMIILSGITILILITI